MEEQKVAYVAHPVSDELKAELRGKGLKIVDAAFAPEGAKVINPHKPRQAAATA